MTTNKAETTKIMGILQTAYPAFYKGQSKEAMMQTILLWQEMFAAEPYELVAAAIKALIATDTKGFPPHIGAVKEQIRKLTMKESLTEMEAWDLVRSVLSNASMSRSSRLFNGTQTPGEKTAAERAFDSLPPEVQGVVHSASQLEAWSQIDLDTLNTVVASNFMRSYTAKRRVTEETAKLPEDVRAVLPRFRGVEPLEDQMQALPKMDKELYEYIFGEDPLGR